MQEFGSLSEQHKQHIDHADKEKDVTITEPESEPKDARCGEQTKPISALAIGDRIVDTSWKWKHRIGPDDWDGDPYSGIGEIKPVV